MSNYQEKNLRSGRRFKCPYPWWPSVITALEMGRRGTIYRQWKLFDFLQITLIWGHGINVSLHHIEDYWRNFTMCICLANVSCFAWLKLPKYVGNQTKKKVKLRSVFFTKYFFEWKKPHQNGFTIYRKGYFIDHQIGRHRTMQFSWCINHLNWGCQIFRRQKDHSETRTLHCKKIVLKIIIMDKNTLFWLISEINNISYLSAPTKNTEMFLIWTKISYQSTARQNWKSKMHTYIPVLKIFTFQK